MNTTEKEKKKSISFAQLIDAIEYNNYRLSSGKKVLELPLYFVLGKSVLSCYEEFYDKYNTLLQDEQVDEDIRKTAKKLSDGLLETVKNYLNGKIATSYSNFRNAMSHIEGILPLVQVEERDFYRMRSDLGLTDTKDFWHIPFNKVYLSKSERFSIEGYPILYLGYSKNVCEKEISEGSLAKFSLKRPISDVLDLTLGQGEGMRFLSDDQLMKVYPLIASCYVVPFYSILKEKECRPTCAFFREEYIIPQFLTMYLKDEKKAKGIIYYSVKDPNLKVYGKDEDDLRNLALYTSRNDGEIYDKQLMDYFEIKL